MTMTTSSHTHSRRRNREKTVEKDVDGSARDASATRRGANASDASGKTLGRRRRREMKRARKRAMKASLTSESRESERGDDGRVGKKRKTNDDDDDDDDGRGTTRERGGERREMMEKEIDEQRKRGKLNGSREWSRANAKARDDWGERERARGGDASSSGRRTAAGKGTSIASSSSFVDKMRAKLSGGQFRMLNERLYTTTGDEGLALVRGAPELFEAYHAGFRAQVESWPTKPVDVIAKVLNAAPKSWVVADFGCGDAELARSIAQKCHSFDLQAPADAPEVVACNMSDVPLDSTTVDCAVFSLSLMGTDYGSFLEEAHRVLKPGGLLWIAEVRSRFDGQNGAASVTSFIAALAKLGFKPKRDPDETNAMFFTAEFIKTFASKHAKVDSKIAWPPLKACAYKRR